ncbi:MAG: hypothetical protein J6V40_01100, partial [Clostridia bacterium]|nr:hypothetical protein [Clostridia bacterium]
GIDGTVVSITNDGVNGNSVGGIIGKADSTVHIQATIDNYMNISAPNHNYVAGIVGWVVGEITLSGRVNSYGAVSGKQYVSGVIGYAQASISLGQVLVGKAGNPGGYAIVSNSGAGESCVGGVIGKAINSDVNTITIESATNNLTITSITGDYVSGIVAYAGAPITIKYDTTNNGEITSGRNYVAGIIAYAKYAVTFGYTGNVNIANNNKITATGTVGNVGGIVGYAESSVKNATGVVLNTSNTGVITAVDASEHVSGHLGYVKGEISISSASNTGNVIAGEAAYVGGVVGRGDDVITISNATYNADVTGNAYVGGIIGYAASSDKTLTLGNITNDSTTVFSVTGKGNYIGGIVGYANYFVRTAAIVNYQSVKSTGTSIGVGGLFGYIKDTLSITGDLTNNGKITLGSNNTTDVGGIAGYIGVRIESQLNTLYNAADINTEAYEIDRIGGIAGHIGAAKTNPMVSVYLYKVSNNGTVSGYEYVGGIFGKVTHSVEFTQLTDRSVQAIGNSKQITGETHNVAGVFGYVGEYITVYGIVQNNGNVTSGTGKVAGIVAEVIGNVNFNTVNNTGNISSTGTSVSTSTNLSSDDYNNLNDVAGIIAFNKDANSTITIENASNTGEIIAEFRDNV